MFIIRKIQHFYFNKYIVKPFSRRRYFLSYSFKYKALWFRVYKVSTRTIDAHLKEASGRNYIYSSSVGYIPSLYRNYFKFAFVRDPVDRFLSAWRDKVVNRNYFNFDEEIHERMKNLPDFIDWVRTLNIEKCDEHLRAQYALIDLNNIDFIGRFENFENDFRSVADKINLPLKEIYHLNKTEDDEAIKDISLKVEKDIISLYRKDCQIFYPNYSDR